MQIQFEVAISDELKEKIKKTLQELGEEDIEVFVVKKVERPPDPWGKRNFIPKENA